MSFHISLDSMHDIHQVLMQTLDSDFDFESAPRGKPIREVIAASFTLMNPRNRLIVSPARAVNYGFGVGELCWYVRGENDLETMAYYNKRMSQFSDDGLSINSAYGYRMFRPRFGRVTEYLSGLMDDCYVSQLDNVIAELQHDPDSRRAVILINEQTDLERAVAMGSKDVPCTLSLQLLIRNRRLHMSVNMRSNDVVWGLPYDVFSFTMLQEAFLYKLQNAGVPVDDLGEYHHHAGSLHVYDTHFDLAKAVTYETDPPPAPMKPFTLEELEIICEELEPIIRRDTIAGGCGGDWADYVDGFLKGTNDSTAAWMIDQLVAHRSKRMSEKSFTKENDVQSS